MALCEIREYPNVEELRKLAEEVLKKRGFDIQRIVEFNDPTTPVRFYLTPRNEEEEILPPVADIVVRWHKVTQNVAWATGADLVIYTHPSDIVIPLM